MMSASQISASASRTVHRTTVRPTAYVCSNAYLRPIQHVGAIHIFPCATCMEIKYIYIIYVNFPRNMAMRLDLLHHDDLTLRRRATKTRRQPLLVCQRRSFSVHFPPLGACSCRCCCLVGCLVGCLVLRVSCCGCPVTGVLLRVSLSVRKAVYIDRPGGSVATTQREEREEALWKASCLVVPCICRNALLGISLSVVRCPLSAVYFRLSIVDC
jgi:hypothetical protein